MKGEKDKGRIRMRMGKRLTKKRQNGNEKEREILKKEKRRVTKKDRRGKRKNLTKREDDKE